jgi:DNA replication and repair protein RecF
MHLKNISVINFKNYKEASLSFHSNVNCFVGNNGGGKTNLLDAIFYLSFSKSYFNPADSQIILHDAPFMVVQGEFERLKQNESIYCGIKRGQKKQFKRNKKEYTRISDHIGLLPLVMISPSDSSLILDGSDTRRRFLDLIISQYDRPYLDHVMSYNKAVSQRNRLLKKFQEIRSFDEESLEIWDAQLIQYGSQVHAARKLFIEQFLPIFQKYYTFISESNEQVGLNYHSQLNDDQFPELLLKARENDRRASYTTTGVHKDDLEFTINGFPIKKFGSQGQQKTYLLALKLAQAEYIQQIKNIPPILLLDDIYDKLDDKRVAKLMEIVGSNDFGQIFITDTHENRLVDIFKELKIDCRTFAVNKGEVDGAE